VLPLGHRGKRMVAIPTLRALSSFLPHTGR
jgi:hypothetical protein